MPITEELGPVILIPQAILKRQCADCCLAGSYTLHTNCMKGEGFKDSVMFVGKYPGKKDDEIGRPMTGPNGEMFYELLRDAGFRQGETFVTNCIKCYPTSGSAGKTHWAACQKHFVDELERVKPRMIVSVGADATEWLTGQTGVMGLIGTGLPCVLDDNYIVYPMRQPMSLRHVDPAEAYMMRQSMVKDLQLIRSIYLQGGKSVIDVIDESVDYKLARTEQDCWDFLRELDVSTPVAVDLETSHFNTFSENPHIVGIGFSTGPGMGRFIPIQAPGQSDLFWWTNEFLDQLVPAIKKFLQTHETFGHNYHKFDAKWLRHEWGIDLGVLKYDTMMAAYASLRNLRSLSLEVLASSYCGMKRWKREFDLSDMTKLGPYGCKDVDATWRLRKEVDKVMQPHQRWLMENILLPLGHQLSFMEERGAVIDMEKLDELEKYLKGRMEGAMFDIRQIADIREWELDTGKNFNPGSPAQMVEILFDRMKLKPLEKTKGGQPSANRATLEYYSESVPFCKNVIEYRRISKLYGTYCTGVRDRIKDGVIHTSWREHGTVTGRLAGDLMQLPREETAGKILEDGNAIKAVYKARPGYCLLEADYSQIELRVIASLSGDETMLGIYAAGGDVHIATAAAVYGIAEKEVSGAQRTGAKKVNFGIIYGKGEKSLIGDFEDAGQTAEDAINFINMHKKKFPKVWDWLEEQKQIVLQHGQQTTVFGRTRYYDNKDAADIRAAMNNPIQSSASDLTLLSIYNTGKELRDRGMKSVPLLTVHDSIIFEVWIDEFWDVCYIVKQTMEGLRFDWLKTETLVDMKAGANWGSLRKVDLENHCLKVGD